MSLDRTRIEQIIGRSFPPPTEAHAYQAAMNEVREAYAPPTAIVAAQELFGRRWSAEFSVLLVALIRGLIARRMAAHDRPVVWPRLASSVFDSGPDETTRPA